MEEGLEQAPVVLLTPQPTVVIQYFQLLLQQAAAKVGQQHSALDLLGGQEAGLLGQTDQIPQEGQEQQTKDMREDQRFQFLTVDREAVALER